MEINTKLTGGLKKPLKLVESCTTEALGTPIQNGSSCNNCNHVTWVLTKVCLTMLTRRALHAGSWYVASGDCQHCWRQGKCKWATWISLCPGVELSSQLDQWLSAADTSHAPARAIIGPYPPFSHNLDQTDETLRAASNRILRINMYFFFCFCPQFLDSDETCWLLILWCLWSVCIQASGSFQSVSTYKVNKKLNQTHCSRRLL